MNTNDSKLFWQAVSELAALRKLIPEERRKFSRVREAVRLDVLNNPKERNEHNR